MAEHQLHRSFELHELTKLEHFCIEFYGKLDYLVNHGILTIQDDQLLAPLLNRLANNIALFVKNERQKQQILDLLESCPEVKLSDI